MCAAILWCTFLAMIGPTFANAALRYTTNVSLVWSVEVVQLTFPWFIMAGAVLAAQHSRHIGVTLLMAWLPPIFKRGAAVVVQGVIVLGCGVVIYVYLGLGMFEGGMAFAAGTATFTSLGVEQSWSYLALLLGYILLGLTAASAIYRLVTDPADEPD